MATKKSKSSNKSNKAKSTKPKTAAKPVEKSELEAPKAKNTNKELKSSKDNVESKVSTKSVKEESHDSDTKHVYKIAKKDSFLSGFFARKYDEKESILTVFKNHKFYGSLLGEVIGTMLLTMLLFSVSLMSIQSLSTYIFAVIALFIAIYAFSGACLNPIVTVGMMASRRMSVIRGVMYIIAEVIGAWLGWLVFNAFHLAGGELAQVDMPALAEVGEGNMWIITAVELLGAIIIAFFFARALKYKRSVFTFAATVAGGMIMAIVMGYVISAGFLTLSNNFIFNPAAATMYQIFPTSGDNFGEVLGGIMQALSIYVLFPMIGGVIGFYLSDFTSRLSGEE